MLYSAEVTNFVAGFNQGRYSPLQTKQLANSNGS